MVAPCSRRSEQRARQRRRSVALPVRQRIEEHHENTSSAQRRWRSETRNMAVSPARRALEMRTSAAAPRHPARLPHGGDARDTTATSQTPTTREAGTHEAASNSVSWFVACTNAFPPRVIAAEPFRPAGVTALTRKITPRTSKRPEEQGHRTPGSKSHRTNKTPFSSVAERLRCVLRGARSRWKKSACRQWTWYLTRTRLSYAQRPNPGQHHNREYVQARCLPYTKREDEERNGTVTFVACRREVHVLSEKYHVLL